MGMAPVGPKVVRRTMRVLLGRRMFQVADLELYTPRSRAMPRPEKRPVKYLAPENPKAELSASGVALLYTLEFHRKVEGL